MPNLRKPIWLISLLLVVSFLLLAGCKNDDEEEGETNTAPSPTAPTITIAQDMSGTIQISAGDPDAGQRHTFTITTQPANGTATVDIEGLLTYTPEAGFVGSDSVGVTVMDDGEPPLSGTVTITVMVIPNIFTLGVASGEVTDTSAVLWTRADQEGNLNVELSTTSDFSAPTVFLPLGVTTAMEDFTAKVVADLLNPATTYFYRWHHESSGSVSVTGTFHTAPTSDTLTTVRFAFTGDSDGTLVDGVPVFNAFEVLDAVRLDNPDFFVYLGDTVYPDSDLRFGGDAQTLEEYRATYRDNRTIAALPNLLQSTSIYAVWDDHEVRNNYAGTTVDANLYDTGRQAFLEYMPLADGGFPVDMSCAGDPLFRTFRWGQAVEVFILDERSCRSEDVEAICQNDPAPTLPAALRLASGQPASPPAGCLDAIGDPTRTMLGPMQKAQFIDALRNSEASFTFVINEVPIQQFWGAPYDRWEGYAAERNEILTFIRDNNIANVIFLTADLHANIINEVFIDAFDDPEPIAHEFITGPVARPPLAEGILMEAGPPGLIAFQGLLTTAGVNCRNLDTFAYGLVEVDTNAGTATVTLKDDMGAVLHDNLLPLIACQETFGP
jgi:alkaline phosphatase D